MNYYQYAPWPFNWIPYLFPNLKPWVAMWFVWGIFILLTLGLFILRWALREKNSSFTQKKPLRWFLAMLSWAMLFMIPFVDRYWLSGELQNACSQGGGYFISKQVKADGYAYLGNFDWERAIQRKVNSGADPSKVEVYTSRYKLEDPSRFLGTMNLNTLDMRGLTAQLSQPVEDWKLDYRRPCSGFKGATEYRFLEDMSGIDGFQDTFDGRNINGLAFTVSHRETMNSQCFSTSKLYPPEARYFLIQQPLGRMGLSIHGHESYIVDSWTGEKISKQTSFSAGGSLSENLTVGLFDSITKGCGGEVHPLPDGSKPVDFFTKKEVETDGYFKLIMLTVIPSHLWDAHYAKEQQP